MSRNRSDLVGSAIISGVTRRCTRPGAVLGTLIVTAIVIGAYAALAASQRPGALGATPVPTSSGTASSVPAAAVTAQPVAAAPPVAPAPVTPAPPPVSGGADGTFVELANVKRASEGKPPVAQSALLETIAAERAVAMAAQDSLFHDLGYVLGRLLGSCYVVYAEVIATESGHSSFSVQRTVDAWWASPAHHAIVAGDFNSAGGGWAQAASGSYYAVMVFATLC